jgi:hypothetical protein
VLTPQDLAALDVPAEPNDDGRLGGARYCRWQKPHSDTPGHTVGVGIFDELGIGEDEITSNTEPQPRTVGAHQAMQYTGGAGVCVVAIGVTESSRVDVSGVSDGDMKRACKVAKKAAKLVEPHLP